MGGSGDDDRDNFKVSGPTRLTQTEIDWYARLLCVLAPLFSHFYSNPFCIFFYYSEYSILDRNMVSLILHVTVVLSIGQRMAYGSIGHRLLLVRAKIFKH
jgi:hypothetical protein